jgi:hypothetical protein
MYDHSSNQLGALGESILWVEGWFGEPRAQYSTGEAKCLVVYEYCKSTTVF